MGKKMKVWEREMRADYPTNPFPKERGGLWLGSDALWCEITKISSNYK
jgi:hypothetical protein